MSEKPDASRRKGGSPPPVSGQFPAPEPEIEARVKALASILTEKGYLSRDMVEKVTGAYERDIGPWLGGRVVARAWVDPAFKRRLLEDATAACAELGIKGMQGEHMVCVENTPTEHHVVVCTLCSCYPWPVLGLPPNWYKFPQYRSKMVANPRRTLREDFGLDLPESVRIHVWDSSAEIRYFVLPQRPPGTEGLTEEELASLVTRDSMIGVAKAQPPAPRRA